jgi:hypothetical protein
MTRSVLALLLLAGSAGGCNKKEVDEDRGAAPPPVASSKPGACASGGGTPSDPVSAAFFPRTIGDYCVDPHGDTRAYGQNAKGTLGEVCTELFDGECEVYKSYGLERVVTLRYIDGQGSPGTVNVNLSRFATKEGAYGFFTKRVVADADPLEASPKKLEAGAAAALGTGIAYVWRGQHVAELSYNNELESPEQLRQSSQRVLPPVAKDLGAKLPGDPSLPPAAALIPEQHRIELGVSYDARDLLDVAGAGPGAIGFFKDGDKRWRVLGAVREDEESAKDVIKTLRKVEGADMLKKETFDGVTFSLRSGDDSPKVQWVVGRRGPRIVGVGDEEYALAGEGEAAKKAAMPFADKLTRVRALLDGQAAPTP